MFTQHQAHSLLFILCLRALGIILIDLYIFLSGWFSTHPVPSVRRELRSAWSVIPNGTLGSHSTIFGHASIHGSG
jgi:hypothetical protein